MSSIKTERLLLRQWQQGDWPAFAAMNADPDVMAFYPTTLNTEESDALAEKFSALISENDWGFWAVETQENKSFIGFVGLNEPTYDLPVTPCVEIGWRLAKTQWGKGYATEAAGAALDFAFRTLQLVNVYSFTSIGNVKSRAVMERLNMQDMNSNFSHPMIPENSPLREHVLYRIEQQQWLTLETP